MTDPARRNRRILIAVTAVLAAVAIVVPVLGVLLAPTMMKDQASTPISTTTTQPVLTIKPVAVRPVIGAFVTTPEECLPPPPTPPDQPLRTCDITKTAVYDLGPEELRVQLTDVDSFLNPLTGKQLVQVTLTDESTKAFAQYTTAHVGTAGGLRARRNRRLGAQDRRADRRSGAATVRRRRPPSRPRRSPGCCVTRPDARGRELGAGLGPGHDPRHAEACRRTALD